MQNFRPVGLPALCLLTFVCSQAFGAVAAKKADIYPATEAEVDPPKPAVVAVKKLPPVPAPKKQKQTPQALAAKLPDSALIYDLVPSDQIDPLAKRLQLVETLIRRYARAYDYRAYTVVELETILSKLDAAAAAKASSHNSSAARLPTPNEKDETSGSPTGLPDDDAPHTDL